MAEVRSASAQCSVRCLTSGPELASSLFMGWRHFTEIRARQLSMEREREFSAVLARPPASLNRKFWRMLLTRRLRRHETSRRASAGSPTSSTSRAAASWKHRPTWWSRRTAVTRPKKNSPALADLRGNGEDDRGVTEGTTQSRYRSAQTRHLGLNSTHCALRTPHYDAACVSSGCSRTRPSPAVWHPRT